MDETIVLNNKDFDRFVEVCQSVPTKATLEAVERLRQRTEEQPYGFFIESKK